jgi:murein tripeptide amidase MpaA
MTRLYYRFRSHNRFDFVTDQGEITVGRLKILIMAKEKLTCDLDILKPESSELYEDDMIFVPNNSSVVARRKPFKDQSYAYRVFRRKDLSIAQKYKLAKNPPSKKVKIF